MSSSIFGAKRGETRVPYLECRQLNFVSDICSRYIASWIDFRCGSFFVSTAMSWFLAMVVVSVSRHCPHEFFVVTNPLVKVRGTCGDVLCSFPVGYFCRRCVAEYDLCLRKQHHRRFVLYTGEVSIGVAQELSYTCL